MATSRTQSKMKKSATKKSATKKSATKKSATKKPAARKSAAKKSATKSATKKSVSARVSKATSAKGSAKQGRAKGPNPATKQGVVTRSAGFLTGAWPALVAKQAPAPSLDAAPIIDGFTSMGFGVPADVAAMLAPLATHTAPELGDLVLGSYAPPVAKDGNLAEQRLLAAQSYRPLWPLLFAAAVEFGSTPSGDIWLYAFTPFDDEARQIYQFDHFEESVGNPHADSLEAFLFTATGGKPPRYKAATANLWWDWARARWVVTALTEPDAADAEIRGAFNAEAAPEITVEHLEERVDLLPTYAPTAFYFAFATFLTGNDAGLARVLALTESSTVPIIRSLAALMRELVAGRTQLGIIEDVQALRARLTKLALWTKPAAPTPVDPAILEEAKREGRLVELCWENVTSPTMIDAISKLWRADRELGPAVKLLLACRQADGYRDEDAMERYLAKARPELLPLLVGMVLSPEHRMRMIAMDLLVDLAEPRIVPLLAPIVRTVNRFHHERRAYTQLAHRIGDRAAVAPLVEIVKKHGRNRERYATETVATAVVALADLGDASAVPAIRALLDAEHKDSSGDAPIGLRDAVLFALAELGDTTVLPQLLERAETPEIYSSAGLRWALGRLAAAADRATQDRVRDRLHAVRITTQTLEHDGVETFRSIDSLLAEDLDQSDDLACELALEHSLVLLGGDDAALTRLVTTALAEWTHREEESLWSDRRFPAWALLAHARMPSLDRSLARPLASLREQPLRTLALRAVAA